MCCVIVILIKLFSYLFCLGWEGRLHTAGLSCGEKTLNFLLGKEKVSFVSTKFCNI